MCFAIWNSRQRASRGVVESVVQLSRHQRKTAKTVDIACDYVTMLSKWPAAAIVCGNHGFIAC